MSKLIKKIFELTFIFILPLIFICLNIEIENDIEYDTNGNYLITNKHLKYNEIIYPSKKYNVYNINQLVSDSFLDVNMNSYDMSCSEYFNYTLDVYPINDIVNINIITDNLIKDHKILLYSDNWTPIDLYLFNYNNFNSSDCYNNDVIITLNNNYNSIKINCYPLETENPKRYNIRIIDLTLMYGNGNEPNQINKVMEDIEDININRQITSELIEKETETITTYLGYEKKNTMSKFNEILHNNLQIPNNAITNALLDYIFLFISFILVFNLVYIPFYYLFNIIRKE